MRLTDVSNPVVQPQPARMMYGLGGNTSARIGGGPTTGYFVIVDLTIKIRFDIPYPTLNSNTRIAELKFQAERNGNSSGVVRHIGTKHSS